MLTHDYDNGLKLMEHSYIKNNFVQTIETLLMPQGKWYKTRIVWAGDYASDLHLLNVPELVAKLDDKYKDLNIYTLCRYEDREGDIPEEFKEFVCSKINPDESKVPEDFKYIVNYDKQMFVDKTKVPEYGEGYQIHPLPLLTCQGNGLGCGDYKGHDNVVEEIVGSWAGDRIGIEAFVPEGFEEIIFNLTE